MITCFRNEYYFLSNMYLCKIYVPKINNITFNSVEHAYQAIKSLDPCDWDVISGIESPYHAKRYGRKMKIRPDWDNIKLQTMRYLLKIKFTHNLYLKEKLLLTKDIELVEYNTWGDTYWGICNNKGENHLGKLLMEIRELVR